MALHIPVASVSLAEPAHPEGAAWRVAVPARRLSVRENTEAIRLGQGSIILASVAHEMNAAPKSPCGGSPRET
jgi:hypothetical protein